MALPSRYWRSPWLPGLAGGLGVFLAGMALLQAWPGRGFWSGTVHAQAGPVASMVNDMASTRSPRPWPAWCRTSARSSRPTASP